MSVFNKNYPPGVTDRDIDEHFGSPQECEQCGGKGQHSNEIEEVFECSMCHGTGIAPDKDYDATQDECLEMPE